MLKNLIVVALLICGGWAMAHSGGTDKNGCHVDHKTGIKHCH